jgi:hypothetical protein
MSIFPSISTKRTIISHLKSLKKKQKNPQRMTLEIQVLAWDMHKKVAVAKLVHQISTPPLIIGFSMTIKNKYHLDLPLSLLLTANF